MMFGFTVMSPVSSMITLNILHLPMSMPEMLFVPFFFFFKKRFEFHDILKDRFFIGLLVIWLFLLGLGLIRTSPFAVISTARTWLYIIIFYCIFIHHTTLRIKHVFMISLGSLIGWFLIAYKNFGLIIQEGEGSITYGPMLAVAIAISYSLIRNKNITFILLTFVCIIIGFISGLRRELAVLLASILFTWIVLLSFKPKNIIKYVMSVIVISSAIALVYSEFSLYVKDNSHFLYDRVILKTELLISGDNSNEGDIDRSKNIIKVITSSYESVLPTGFVNKQFVNADEKDANGLYNDLPLTELLAMLGFGLTICLISYFIYADIRLYQLISKGRSPVGNIVFITVGAVMVMLLFLEGSYFTYPYCAPYTGYLLGSITKESRIRFHLKK